VPECGAGTSDGGTDPFAWLKRRDRRDGRLLVGFQHVWTRNDHESESTGRPRFAGRLSRAMPNYAATCLAGPGTQIGLNTPISIAPSTSAWEALRVEPAFFSRLYMRSDIFGRNRPLAETRPRSHRFESRCLGTHPSRSNESRAVRGVLARRRETDRFDSHTFRQHSSSTRATSGGASRAA